MADAYSGSLVRSAHFAFRPPVPGINPEHERPDPDPDPFSPAPEGVQPAAFDVWQPQDDPSYSEMRQRPFSHWAALQDPVPLSVPSDAAGIAATARMIANHSQVDFRPDTYVPYKHADQGRAIDFVTGRGSTDAGENVPEEMSYLVMGTNAYDRTNGLTEVYGADQGRYRLGTLIQQFGLYELPTKVGKDAELRAYTGLQPDFPVDKPRVEDSAPYVPNSSGTTTWTMPPFNVPSMFGLPSETASTDHEAAQLEGYFNPSEFDDGGRM